jgi:hypothetical protein
MDPPHTVIPNVACLILPIPRSKNVCYEMDSAILKPFGKMREVLNQLIVTSKLEGLALLDFLRKKTPLLQSLDATCCIELAVMQGLLGEGGLALMQAAIIQSLPSKGSPRNIEHCLQLLTEVGSSGTYTFTGPDAQRTHDAVKEMLGSMLRGKPPKIAAMQTDVFMAQVADLLPELCIEIVGGEKGKEKTLTGKDAVKAKLDKAGRAKQ